MIKNGNILVNEKEISPSYKIKENCTIEFLDLTSPEGNRAHINGLILLIYIFSHQDMKVME